MRRDPASPGAPPKEEVREDSARSTRKTARRRGHGGGRPTATRREGRFAVRRTAHRPGPLGWRTLESRVVRPTIARRVAEHGRLRRERCGTSTTGFGDTGRAIERDEQDDPLDLHTAHRLEHHGASLVDPGAGRPVPRRRLRSTWATFTTVLVLVYYIVLLPRLALGMAFVLGASGSSRGGWTVSAHRSGSSLAASSPPRGSVSSSATRSRARNRSFFEDVQFLLIGPLWLLGFVYRRLGIPYR